jgi:hypothetical protein
MTVPTLHATARAIEMLWHSPSSAAEASTVQGYKTLGASAALDRVKTYCVEFFYGSNCLKPVAQAVSIPGGNT